ncbi:MAG: DNA-binding protein [Thermodesulfobacteriota bacterium]
MKKYSAIILAGLICFLLAGVPWAQAQGDGKGKPELYDLKTVETLQGIVVAAPKPTPKGGMPERAQLTLKTPKETLTVYLGPGWFLEKQGLKIGNLDQVQVTGSRILVQGQPALLAGEVRKGEQVLKLRDEQGQPLWRGSRNP